MEFEIKRDVYNGQDESFISLYVTEAVYAIEILSELERAVIKCVDDHHPARTSPRNFIRPGNISSHKLLSLISSLTTHASQSTKIDTVNNLISIVDKLDCTIDNDHPFNVIDGFLHDL